MQHVTHDKDGLNPDLDMDGMRTFGRILLRSELNSESFCRTLRFLMGLENNLVSDFNTCLTEASG